MSIRILDTVAGKTLTLPVMPDKVKFKSGTKFIEHEILDVGDVCFPHGEELSEISFSGMLPGALRTKTPNSWIESWRSPREIESIWSIWRNQGRRLRVTIDGTPLNHGMYLQSYEMEYSGGFGDYGYSITFVAAKVITIGIEEILPEYTGSGGGSNNTVNNKRYVTVTGNRVNVRRKASMSGKIVFVAKKGEKYEYAGEKSGNWYSILVDGETLWISSKYSTLSASSETSSTSSGSQSSSGQRTYTVKKGDNLWGIAQKFYGSGAKYTRIQKANNLSGTTIYVGQKLVIP